MYFLPRKCQSLLHALSSLVLVSCQSTTESPSPVFSEPQTIVYKINKGKHSTVAPFVLRTTTAFKFEATFDGSAVYQTHNHINQADINKLYGIADCGTEHHSNSARFGWRWYNDKLEIHAYTYQNRERQSQLIGVVELNKTYSYEIRMEENNYVFTLGDRSVTLPRGCHGPATGYQLYPYFGGDETAPHDITIAIKELKSKRV